MSLKLPIGESNFRSVIEKGYYLVDKTFFIESILEDPAKVILFPRPRRFGKTLNLSMLYYFLEGYLESRHEDLFQGLAISKNKALCEQYQNRYPVIFLTFKDIKEDNYETSVEDIKILLRSLFQRFKVLLYTDLEQEDKLIYDAFSSRNATISDLKHSLVFLSRLLYEKTGQKVVILIDEYDTPMTQAYVHGYYESMTNLVRGILSALKDNQYVEKAILTGITRVAKESIFSDLNNFVTFTVLNRRYSDVFGFTEGEVAQLLKDDNRLDQQEKMKDWYNGYRFGEKTIYNPWSIINCVYHDYVFNHYWVNTSSNKLIQQLLGQSTVSTKAAITQLLQGEMIREDIDENLVFTELSISDQALWSLMLSSGYVTARSHEFTRGIAICELAIPNREVLGLYEKVVTFWFNTSSPETRHQNYKLFIDSLIEGNVKAFNHALNTYLQESGSYFDFNRHSSEKVFHTFVLGLVVGLSERYHIQSNRESGFGRFDVLLEPKESKDAGIVLEFKVTSDREALEKTAEIALEQIKEKQYLTTLKQRGVKRFELLGIGFCGQQALVKRERVGEENGDLNRLL